jgi:hypothetical protein
MRRKTLGMEAKPKAPRACAAVAAASSPRRREAAGLLFCLLCAAGSGYAFEVPTASGLSLFDGPGDRKRLTLFLGAGYGTDSNFRLAPPGDPEEESSALLAVVGGVGLEGGNYHRKLEARYQAKIDRYLEPGEDVVREHRLVGGLGSYSERLQFSLRGRYARLVDPVDIVELGPGGRLNREEVTYVPELSVSSGRTELGFGYSSTTWVHDEATRLDHEDAAWSAELRWWRSEVTQLFLHGHFGSVDYDEAVKPGFAYRRYYAGLRRESPGRMGVELGAGVQSLDDFESPVAGPASDFYYLLRLGFTPEAGTSKLEVASALVDEASARSAYKSRAFVTVSYSRAVNRRFTWELSGRCESLDLTAPEADTPDSLLRWTVEGGLSLDVGALERFHGRFYVTASYDHRERTGGVDTDAFDYDRLRLVGGFALVY